MKRWTIWVCSNHGSVNPGQIWSDGNRHCGLCSVPLQEIEVVPASEAEWLKEAIGNLLELIAEQGYDWRLDKSGNARKRAAALLHPDEEQQ